MGMIKAFWNMHGQVVPNWLSGKIISGEPGQTLSILTGKVDGETEEVERGQFIVAGHTPILYVVNFDLYHDIIHPYTIR